VLAAIERLERVIRGNHDQQLYHAFRGELLDMARAIAQTRAEVAESKPPGQAQDKAAMSAAAPAGGGPDVFAAAQRIQDVVWTSRAHGLDPATCQQIEALAATILTASSLRDPNDHRTRKLGAVLQYLEQRIDAMLAACAQAAEAAVAVAEAAPAI